MTTFGPGQLQQSKIGMFQAASNITRNIIKGQNIQGEEEKRNHSPSNDTAVEMTFGMIAGGTASALG